MDLKEIDLKIQCGELISSEDLNKLWDHRTNCFKLKLYITTTLKGELKFKYYPVCNYIMRLLK